MRRARVLLALTSALIVVPSAAAATPRCRPPSRDVVARSGSNVVFIRAMPGGEYPGPVTVYGCYSVHHSARRLLDFPDDSSGEFLKLGPAGRRARISGHFAAFSLSFDDGPCEHYALASDCTSVVTASYNLRTGRRRALADDSASDIALTPAGWFAWTSRGDAMHPLLAVDQAGRRTLDPGPIEAGSLRASGAQVSWRSGGAARSATLR